MSIQTCLFLTGTAKAPEIDTQALKIRERKGVLTKND
jgi:hypothetical protein